MPLVLTTNAYVPNPEHAWNDLAGVHYHYPNVYKGKIKTGEEFIYYRGVLRERGPRAQAEYFGRGRIGQITPDPATIGQSRPSWFCAIEDFVPFDPCVPAKRDGVFFEVVKSNTWRTSVRVIDQTIFDQIIAAAGQQPAPRPTLTIAEPAAAASGPVEVSDLIIPKAKTRSGAGKTAGVGYRRSKRAKEVGDWAENLVVEFLKTQGGCVEIEHRAAKLETPGWDIDYRDANGVLHRVEVKGTVGSAFSAIDLTANELRAAQQHGSEYWIFLVANCLTEHPRIQRICAPAERLNTGDWVATPALYSVSLG